MPNVPIANAVVDTNIFVSGLITIEGNPHRLLEAWRAGAFVLVIGGTQREELERVLRRPVFAERYGLNAYRVAHWLLLVDTLALRASARRRLPVHVRDPKDDHLLAAAIGGNTDYLVTGDRDLLDLRGHPRLKTLQIVTASEFLDALNPVGP